MPIFLIIHELVFIFEDGLGFTRFLACLKKAGWKGVKPSEKLPGEHRLHRIAFYIVTNRFRP
jgi:hypothetical protein